MYLGRLTLFTVDLVVELLGFVELCQAVVQSRVICLIKNFISFLTSRCVLNDFIGHIVVAFGENFGVPLDDEETFFDHVFHESWCVSWL